MIIAGMDVARFNMSYFPISKLEETVLNLKLAAKECNRQIGIMVDLIGASVKTLGHENEQTEVIVTEGD